MARPRKYAQIDGRTIDGVSFHKATNRYYIYDRNGKQVYFRSWREASDAYQLQNGNALTLAKQRAAYAVRHAALQQPETLEKIIAMFAGDPDAAMKCLESCAPEQRFAAPNAASDDTGVTADAFADTLGVPEFAVVDVSEAAPSSASSASPVPATSNPRLTEVGERWLQHKMNEQGISYVDPDARKALRDAGKRSPLTSHMRDTMARWQHFIDCAGDVRVSELNAEHFRKFATWADKEAVRKASTRWHGQQFAAVKNIFNYGLRQFPDWAWPPGISERLRSYTAKPYVPRDDNTEPMPSGVFHSLLAQCDAWAQTDVEQFDRTTQSGRAKRLQALRKQRDGRQMRVVLELTINCGLNAVDCERITWSNLKLTGDLPHMDFPRRKTEHSVGRATPRKTPLLPPVIKSLRAWQKMESHADKLVFHSAQGTPLAKDQISRTVTRLLKDAGLEQRFTYKHLRNVGSSLASDQGLPEEMIQCFLGHVPQTVSSRYKGSKKPSYLKPLVELIDQQYLNGAG